MATPLHPNPLRAVASVAALLLCSAAAPGAAQNCVTEITDGYGSVGPYSVRTDSVRNPEWRFGKRLTVYSPIGGPTPRPVVFVAHGWGGNSSDNFDAFMRQMASTGSVVVFTPYPTLAPQTRMYEVLRAGMDEAVDELGTTLSMDTSRMGIFGHSFGGGATPHLYQHALDQGWGSNGAWLFVSAPWYLHEITAAQIAAFPAATTNLLIQVYDDDTVNDHEIAIQDLWNQATSLPDAQRDYLLLRSASNASCQLVADHVVPAANQTPVDGYDRWGVWRRADALGQCTWWGNSTACQIALGNGSAAQTDMGAWVSDGTPVEPAVWMATPVSENCQPGEACTFPY